MNRTFVLLAILPLGLACDSTSITPVADAGLSIRIAQAAQVAAAALDEGRVRIEGPTPMVLTMAPGTTRTIVGLLPGQYTVALEGLVAGQVESFGETSGVAVAAGSNTSVTVVLQSFVPALSTAPGSGRTGTDIEITHSLVPGAISYRVFWSDKATFDTSFSTLSIGGRALIRTDRPGLLYVRVQATNRFVSISRYSPTASIRISPGQWQMIDAGASNTCGLASGGVAYCWGDNSFGGLGDGTTTARTAPTAVASNATFRSLAAGSNHACGVTTAFAPLCWGSNDEGQLGDGTTVTRPLPNPVSTSLGFADLSVGADRYTCGRTVGAVAYCWGKNVVGELGDGTVTSRSTPTPVSGGLTFTELHTGGDHTCGLTPAAAAYCWGYGLYGRLGDGTGAGHLTPSPVTGNIPFSRLVVGWGYTCGLSATGITYCWGFNNVGQIGDGTTTNRSVPTPVSAAVTFVQIAARGHTCALTAAGVAYCWGPNASGQLGDGTTTDRLVPTPVLGGLRFNQISTGGDHTCGITDSGAAYCWGRNDRGQLGDGTTAGRLVPTPVG